MALNFRLPRSGRPVLTVVDPQGRRVRGLLYAGLEAGDHAVSCDGCDEAGRQVAEGLYFARIEFGDRAQARKLAILR